MKQLLFILLFIPIVILAQNRKEKLFISNNLIIKKLSKSPNYIEEPVRLSLTEYLKTKNMDPDKYFVDSFTYRNKDTLIVNIWDVVDYYYKANGDLKREQLLFK